MRITRLYLRNYRVFETELELEVPAGLVGVFGPNGAGKSYLIEAIPWTLFGYTRTDKADVRSSGVNAECVTELEFEHEGNLYMVRRQVAGQNSTVKAEVHANRSQVAEGVRDSSAYMHSILGMDSAAFRASVFAEQKQLASFSGETAAKRRDLVLRLLGVTPLDVARDAARKDARERSAAHDQARRTLPDLAELETARDHCRIEREATEPAMAEALAAAKAARQAASDSEALHERLEAMSRVYEQLVTAGKGHARDRDLADTEIARLTSELAALSTLSDELVTAQAAAAPLERLESRLRAARAVADADRALAAAALPVEPPEPDEAGANALVEESSLSKAAVAGLDAQLQAATSDLSRAEEAVRRSGELSGEADCPVCGQALGAATAQVLAHRTEESAAAKVKVKELTAQQARARKAAKAAKDSADAASHATVLARSARLQFEQAKVRHDGALAALAAARGLTDPPADAPEVTGLERSVGAARAASAKAAELGGRLTRRPQAETELATQRLRRDEAEQQRAALLVEVKALDFQPAMAVEAKAIRDSNRTEAERAQDRAHQAELANTRSKAAIEEAVRRLDDARGAHLKLDDLAVDARHLSRLAELLNQFRNSVVAMVGPTLASHAAALFAELTDREYDDLEVDPNSFDLRITDHGRTYGMDRFSGSETDLANLALRVAISENIRLQSGGAVGLLVLDEVFGPLDDERRDRMLRALEQLRARFQQILVVTHAADVKEQLPNAIEVVKLPGRRATARLVV